MTVVAAINRPQRIMSPAQTALMLRREDVVLRERTKGKSFYKIEREHRHHREDSGDECECGGIQNADRIFKRALSRDENVEWRRQEALRLEGLRLDELQEGIWDKALGGDSRAVEVALKVLERRARLYGLDFADMISGQLVEVERAKVKVMATALVQALQAIDATPEQRKAATAAFFDGLRAVAEEVPPQFPPDPAALAAGPYLTPEDEELL